MKVALDAGHGMSSRTAGVFDPGAVNNAFREADIALRYVHALDDEAQARGWPTFLTRHDNETHAPLGQRVKAAKDAGCTVLISLHVNAALTSAATGVETLYRASRDLADHIQPRVADVMGLRDRGVKFRDDLAILRFTPSVLVELGFISNQYDLVAMMKPERPALVASAICNGIEHSMRGDS